MYLVACRQLKVYVSYDGFTLMLSDVEVEDGERERFVRNGNCFLSEPVAIIM